MSKRVAIVTGGAGGIGQAITEALTQEGIQVVIADLQEAEGHAIATKLNAHAVTTDLARPRRLPTPRRRNVDPLRQSRYSRQQRRASTHRRN